MTSDVLQPVPVPSTVTFHTGDAVSLAHRMADDQKNPAALVFLPQPMGPPCQAAAAYEEALLTCTTYHEHRATVNSMDPMDLLFVPDSCLLFRYTRLYHCPQQSTYTRLSLAISQTPPLNGPNPHFRPLTA